MTPAKNISIDSQWFPTSGRMAEPAVKLAEKKSLNWRRGQSLQFVYNEEDLRELSWTEYFKVYEAGVRLTPCC